ncbi:isoprenylcysteine carboxylmethyltransferase family protein [Candidatus Woesearchaeota archaeon]|nr:isoprenylcysteine carboxylmethyltransferase family protein [Candidatus Woesearchaeota archaeon]
MPKIDQHEKTVLLFVLVKVFFLPLMLNFLFNSLNNFQNGLGVWRAQEFAISMQSFNSVIYPALVALIFVIDTAYFSFGYAIESSWLRNTVRSVEPTFFGWIVTLACYPPFNAFFGNYVGWYANDYVQLSTEGLTFTLRIAVLVLFLIYVWATIALGAKCSNLTNRGIVSRGPYAFVRHPAYVAKNLAWAITVLPLITSANPVHSAAILATTGAWALVYFFRAITEERHLIADKDYQEYCKKVRYRFIPGVF